MINVDYLPHTADIRMKLTADSLPELFKAGMVGMGNLLYNDICNDEPDFENNEKIHVLSSSITTLLVDFLSEILTLSHIHKIVYCHIEVELLSEKEFSGIVFGKKVPFFDEDIKAVTYHEADVIMNGGNRFESIIVFDI